MVKIGEETKQTQCINVGGALGFRPVKFLKLDRSRSLHTSSKNDQLQRLKITVPVDDF